MRTTKVDDTRREGSRDVWNIGDFAVFDPPKGRLEDHLIVGFDTRDRRSRAFSLLRTSVAKKFSEQGTRLIGVTSATPGAGKSYLSMNLAASLSRVQDNPVFLVDLDLRRSSLSEQIGLESSVGIASVLAGSDITLSECGYRIANENVVVFPTGPVKDVSAELLSGQSFESVVQELRTRTAQSIVLFDLPPAFANDDTMLSAQHLDGYIIIADSGRTTDRQVREVMRIMEPSICLGAILNRYDGGLGDEYGYGYGSSAYANYYD
ncbi:CpsD/CapB family tyrosine-protein kinase [Tsuneonella amylolytica]|uniref:CpsD/CapB family tyrosine-protein kinase n=1 Tax=Tsuneonella amylolytica TaxID=2338327 RepID=UPI000EAA0D83|nr:CpsD/CapB family tyrosine-protein kinase [Tsuneonella amylolytica]